MFATPKGAAMSRTLMTLLLSSALAFGNIGATASFASERSVGQPTQLTDRANNQAPLPPAGAAGIKQAQGQIERPILAVAIIAGLIGLWILLDDDDDDDDSSSTTGT